MLKLTNLIQLIETQQTNSFVSKHLKWNTELAIPVQMVQPKLQDLMKLINELRNKETGRLKKIVKEKRLLKDFLIDKRINPRPDLIMDLDVIKVLDSLNFTVACLPIKSENALKTFGPFPDLAEIALLVHFETLAKVISLHFAKPTSFTLLHEVDAYGSLFGIPKATRQIFLGQLLKLASFFNPKFVQVINWQEELIKLNNFDSIITEMKLKIRKELAGANQTTESELIQIFPTIYMSIGTSNANQQKIYLLTSHSIDSEIIAHARKARAIAIRIMAFNHARKMAKERQILFPTHLKGSLTPSQGSWLFWSIGNWNTLYPHHGIGVLNKRSGKVTVQYAMNLTIRSHAENVILSTVKSVKI